MIPALAMHAHAPWAVLRHPNMADPFQALAAARPARRPVYKESEDGYDLAEDWSLAAKHNQARLMIQTVGKSTAVLQVKGMILKDCPFWAWQEGYATPLSMLDAALDMVAEGTWTSLILDCNSPGGSVLGLFETADRIRNLSRQGVQTTAYTSGICASAMYFLATACQAVFAAPTAVVGSIGTYSVFVDTSAMDERIGLKYEVFIAREAPLKGAGESGSLTDAQREEMQRHVDEADSMFQAQVKGSRKGLDMEKASTGAWWYANSCPKGLLDDSSTFYSLNDLLSILAA